jgi:epsilon-lactone hydrolase
MSLYVPPAIMREGARVVRRLAINPRLPWTVQRRRLDWLVGSWPLPRGTSVTKTTLNGIPADVVTARQPGPGTPGAADRQASPGEGTAVATVVHFHGGGYCTGSPAEPKDWAAHLSVRAGCRVILPDYRLAPEHPYPAGVEDACAVLSAVLAEAAPGPVVVSGDSAGGGLALITALALNGQGNGTGDDPEAGIAPGIAGCILLSPWLDLTVDWAAMPELARRDVVLSPAWLEACAEAYAPSEDRAQPAISPLYADLAGLPPLLIQSGTDDLLHPDAHRLAARARDAGVDVTYTRWPHMWHDFVLQPDLVAAANNALTQAAWFIGQVCAAD